MRRTVLALTWSLLLAATGVAAQEIRVEGDVGHPAAALLRDVAARASYTLIHRDTILPADTRIPGDLVVVDADVRLEGSVGGSVVVLPGGEFFLRPGGSVAGATATLGGGVHLSRNATAGERLELPADIGARVEYQGTSYVVRLSPPPAPPMVEPGGIFGVGFPTYDRVNGLTLRASGRARFYPDTAAPVVTATALYYSARRRFGAELGLLARLDRRHYLRAEAARHVATNDAWIRGDLTNSLGAAFFRSDLRDYHEEEILAVEVGRDVPVGLSAGEGFVVPRIRASTSTAESLVTRDAWSLFGDEWRENPAIQPGRITSGTAGARAGWRGATSMFAGDASLEWAPPGVGDHHFSLLTLDGRWDMIALWGHTVSLRGHFLHPLGSSAPPQRWSFVGGPGTLPTLRTASVRGDHLVFVESAYAVPLRRIVLPLVGSPALVTRHAVGSAWSAAGPAPDFEQNLGLGLAFPFLRADLYTNPVEPERVTVSVSASLPI